MKKGFTLVELLIVLAVIAALMAVATPMALNAVRQAKVSQVAQNLQSIKTAVENYVSTERKLPDTNVDSTTYLKGYLTTFPSGYNIDIDRAFTNGQAFATITYTAGDVKPEDVNSIYPEATWTKNPGGIPVVYTSFQKWW